MRDFHLQKIHSSFCRAATAFIDLLTRCYHHHHSPFTISKKVSLFYVCVCLYKIITNRNIYSSLHVCVCFISNPFHSFATTTTTTTTTILVFVFSGREQNVRKKKRLMVTAIPRGKHHFSPDQ